MRVLLRVIIGSLIAAIVMIAMVPLLVLRDLNSGGSGWGLCTEGVDGCTNSYFVGFELIAIVVVALFVVAVLLRIAVKSLRWTEHHYDRTHAATAAVQTRSSAESPSPADW